MTNLAVAGATFGGGAVDDTDRILFFIHRVKVLREYNFICVGAAASLSQFPLCTKTPVGGLSSLSFLPVSSNSCLPCNPVLSKRSISGSGSCYPWPIMMSFSPRRCTTSRFVQNYLVTPPGKRTLPLASIGRMSRIPMELAGCS